MVLRLFRILLLPILILTSSCESGQQDQDDYQENSLEYNENGNQEDYDQESDDNYENNEDEYEDENDENNEEYENDENNENEYEDENNEEYENSENNAGDNTYENQNSYDGLQQETIAEGVEQASNYQEANTSIEENPATANSDKGTGDAEIAEEIIEEAPEIGTISDTNKFSASPYLLDSMRIMADGEAPEEYTVELGDTLFDICSQLLGEGSYWPKLWSLNVYIKNPHFIWPGMKLRFYPGDEEDPPFIEVAQEKDVVPIAKSGNQMEDIIDESILPKSSNYNLSATEVIGSDEIQAADDTFESSGELYGKKGFKVTLPGFIFAEKLEGLCTVLTGALGEVMTIEEQMFICDPESEVNLSQSYTALRFIEEVDSPQTRDLVGYRYQFIAHVKFRKIFDLNKQYIGVVTKSRLGLRKNDIIVPYHSTDRFVSRPSDTSNLSSADARIVSFGMEGRQIGGEGQFAFIDKGTNSGIAKGQTLKLDQNMRYLDHNYEIEQDEQDSLVVGYLRIVDATEVGSVGYILNSKREIFLGDMVGKS